MVEKDITYTLFSFAYCGSEDGLSTMLDYLANIAEKETWEFSDDKPRKILRSYIFKTFEQCNKQGKILYSSDNQWCCTNTGLLTTNGKDIMMVFSKNAQKNNASQKTEWFLRGFYSKVDREYMDHFIDVPKLATYTDSYSDLYFNPDFNIEVNTEHILDDNWERISTVVNLPKNIVKTLLQGVMEESKIRVKRNMRLVVPQYYMNKIMYLMPINIPIAEDKYITMALAIEKTSTNQYRANTILTKDMAYEKARLLMKPESNWLIE